MPPSNPEPFLVRLRNEILAAYDEPTLEEMLLLRMNIRLFIVVSHGPFGTVVTDLLVVQVQTARMQEFIDQAVADRPGRQVLKQLADEHRGAPVAAAGPFDSGIATDWRKSTFAIYDDALDDRRRERFRKLSGYKRLHDCIHKLDGALEDYGRQHEARRTAGTALPTPTVVNLKRYKSEANRFSQEVGNKIVTMWNRTFAEAVDAFIGADTSLHGPAWAELADTPGYQLPVLHTAIVSTASDLNMDDFLERLRVMDASAKCDPRVAVLSDPISRLKSQCELIRTQIEQHGYCQAIDLRLRPLAERPTVPKHGDIASSWSNIRSQLKLLLDEQANDFNADQGATVCLCTAAEEFRTRDDPGRYTFVIENFPKMFKDTDTALRISCGDLDVQLRDLTETLEGLRR